MDPLESWYPIREKLLGLLQGMPAAQVSRGEFPTKEGLLGKMMEQKPFQVTGNEAEQASNWWNPAGLLGKIVYHGSPHKFDKFDASKIGTGEGAQAYGHGVYLADSPGVAKDYADKLGTVETLLNGKKIWPVDPNFEAAISIGAHGYDDALSMAKRDSAAQLLTDSGRAQAAKRAAEIEALKGAKIETNPTGALYKADLPDEWIPKMLDWDKPLKEQPEVLKAIKDKVGGVNPSDTGELLYATLQDRSHPVANGFGKEYSKAAQQSAANQLQQLGIPGIRYLDGGSRSAGKGSYNYVVFPGLEDKIKILERNGMPLGLLGK